MKLSAMEREIAIALVEALVEYGLNDHLAQYGERGTENWFWDMNLGLMGFGAAGGASKACIWHEDLEYWVIKVGYTEKVNCDYAKLEYQNYCLAQEAGLAYYFPTTVFLGEFGGRPYYLQEVADCCEDRVTSEWYERLCDEYEECGEEYNDDDIWNVVYDLADEEKVSLCFHDEELLDFLSENRIGDLHEGNFGYIGDRMVIVDFSGWRG